jgi:hypothetical protein
MPGQVLTTASTIMCPHGGSAILMTSNARVTAGAPVLLETDIHPVAGCPFVIGLKPSPCIRIQWQAGATRVNVNTPVLVQSSIGICYSPESAPQGIAIIVNTQLKVSAQ